MFPSTATAQDVSASEPADAPAVENTYIDKFVQEGTPAPVGGRLIPLDPFSTEGPSYVMPPSYSMTKGGGYPFSPEVSVEDGVLDTAFVSFARLAAVYRSDGSIEQFDDGGNWMPDVPAESGVLSMAGGLSGATAFVVTGDGDLTTAYSEVKEILPEDPQDLGYSAVAAGDGVVFALRGNGEVVGFAKPVDRPRLKCQDHWEPVGGTRYTAISAAGGSWMALRSDGAVVTCGYAEGPDPYVGEVHAAPSGSAFVGVDAGRVYGLAASTTGAVKSFGSTSLVPPQPPEESSVVGLSAGARTGAYILSDGSLTTWGKPLTMPDLPAGTDRFIAISENAWGKTFAIWAHEVLDLSIDITVPETVRIGEPVNARVEVALDGVYRPDGKLCLVDYNDSADGQCIFDLSDGVGTIRMETDESAGSSLQGPGGRRFGVGFISPVGRFTYTTATFEVLPPAVTQITANVPASYSPGTDVTASFIVNVEDETVPVGEVLLRAVIGEDDDDLGYKDNDVNLGYVSVRSTDPVVMEIDSNALPDGQYAVKAKYIPESRHLEWFAPTAPAQWRGTLTVESVFVVSGSPSVAGAVQVGKTLTAMRGPWTPAPTTNKYQWRLDGRSVSGATGQTWKVPATAKGKKVSVAITGSKTGYATKTLVSPATTAVKAGVFVAPTPTITGSARVGATLQVLRGTWAPQPSTVKYQWKVAGRPVAGATRSTFTVPSSARGKRVAVVVTGSLAGYTTKSVSQSMTSVIR